MKKYFRIAIIIFASLFLAVSCSSDDNNGIFDNGGSPANGTFTAKIDGVDFKANYIVGMDLIDDEAEDGARTLTINTAQDDQDILFLITIIDYTGPGVYSIIEEGKAFVSIIKENNNNSYWIAPYGLESVGEFRISSHSGNRIKGSFELKAGDPWGDIIVITEGNFDFQLGFVIPTD